MRSSITLVLAAGALALAGSVFAAESTTADVTISTPHHDYKAELDKCKSESPTYQAPCRDAVGMREAEIDRSGGTVTEEMGSLQARDKCERLNPDARRDCLLSEQSGQ
jgi:hypothetical protein